MKLTIVHAIVGTVRTVTHDHPHISVSSGAHPGEVIVSRHDGFGGKLLCDHRYTDTYTVDRQVSG